MQVDKPIEGDFRTSISEPTKAEGAVTPVAGETKEAKSSVEKIVRKSEQLTGLRQDASEPSSRVVSLPRERIPEAPDQPRVDLSRTGETAPKETLSPMKAIEQLKKFIRII